jgi:hypothetical protein
MNLELPVEVKGYAVVLRDLFISLKKACQWGVLHPALTATLHLLDTKARELVGRGVVWGNLNSFTNVINSAASALHALIEYVQGRFIGRAVLLARDREFSKELAGTFFATIKKMLDEGIYVIPGDLVPTYIAVTDSEVVMRLGSAAGHAARIDMERGVLRYFDEDDDVKRVLLKLIAEFVPVKSYEITEDELVVYFEPSRENVKRLVAVLPLAISMDARLGNTSAPIETEFYEAVEQGDYGKALAILEELGIDKGKVWSVAKTVQQALTSIEPPEVSKYIRQNAPEINRVMSTLRAVVTVKA